MFSFSTIRNFLLLRSLIVSTRVAAFPSVGVREYNQFTLHHRSHCTASFHQLLRIAAGQSANIQSQVQFHYGKVKTMPPRRAASKMALAAISSGVASNDDTEESKPKAVKGSAAAATKKRKAATTEKKKASPKKRASPKKVAKGSESSGDDDEPKAKKKTSTPKKRKAKSTATKASSDSEDDKTKKKKKASPKKKSKAADHQRWTECVPLTRLWNPETALTTDGSYTFTVISWNVAGLRAFIKKQPDALANLADKYQADVICLQEHKLQETHLDDPKLKIREHFDEKLGDFESHWSYSTTKKGYSGTAMFIRKRGDDNASKKGKKQAKIGAFFTSKKDGKSEATKGESIGDISVSDIQPLNVMTELGLTKHDGEGRTVTAEFPLFCLTNVYVPNSGQKLDRLGYRTEEWDKDFLNKMQEYEKNKPVIWLGDLNVAHNEKDTWNEGAKHLVKSAGTTPQERASFDRQLGAGFVDAFRHLYPDAMGHYSYWSQRAGNREPNKGLRLDYFVCSKDLMEESDDRKAVVRDSYMLPDELGSDHCPIVLEIEIKK